MLIKEGILLLISELNFFCYLAFKYFLIKFFYLKVYVFIIIKSNLLMNKLLFVIQS